MKVAVIGAGVAGCFVAAILAERGFDVTVYDGNDRALKKMFITGKGRCNLTNYTDSRSFLQSVVTNPKFLYSALSEFDSYDTYTLFESLGVPLKVERGDRVFPVSDKSGDIVKALFQYAERSGAKFLFRSKVTSVAANGAGYQVSTGSAKSIYDRVVIATGGISYPATGSRGDGYSFARAFGHTIVPPVPALSGFLTRDDVSSLAGLTLKNVRLTVDNDGVTAFSEMGEMLFTHTGISGPLCLTASSYVNRCDFSKLRVTIDLKPALDDETLDARILRDFLVNKNREFKNALFELLPKNMIPAVIAKSGIAEDKKVCEITVSERTCLVSALKHFTLEIVGLCGIEEAIITSGGVSVREVHPKNMESKLAAGLYFVGEVIDVDALTGGFNIQIALSTANACGRHMQ